MRINVYSQELTKEIHVVQKQAADTGILYHGVRMMLASPDVLHHTEDDDDRSAITFWIPNAHKFMKNDLVEVFDRMAACVRECPDPQKND